MKTLNLLPTMTTGILAIFFLWSTPADSAPSTADQMAGLQTMCDESVSARESRQKQKSLYLRLGGYEKILALTTEVVRLHQKNPTIIPMLKGVDCDLLAKHVADFAAAGTGGPEKYTGRPMVASHAHLNLTDADFLSAGGDIIKAMQNQGYQQNEIDEFICILVSLKDQVVFQ